MGENDKRREKWVKKQTALMLSGKIRDVIDDFRARAKMKTRTKNQVEKLEKTANYFERNLAYMDYPTYLANGYPIASGVIEGACRHFVKDRFELSGMRWEQSGAENLLRLRAVAENGDWDEYHLFRRQERHQKLYTSPFPEHNSFEAMALKLPTSTTLQSGDLDVVEEIDSQVLIEHKIHFSKATTPIVSLDYDALPLVI